MLDLATEELLQANRMYKDQKRLSTENNYVQAVIIRLQRHLRAKKKRISLYTHYLIYTRARKYTR